MTLFWTTSETMNEPVVEKNKKVVRRIKFESELDREFGDRIAHHAYGEKLFSCIQCGTCSATCPLSHYMDYTPRRVIQMVREGFHEEVLNSTTIWLCASCYSCTVECPRAIKITDVMYALKREAITEGIYPKRFPVPVLARKFFSQVMRWGRLNEMTLMISMYLSTNPLNLFKQIGLGLRMFMAGRLGLFDRGIRGKRQLKKLLKAVDRKEGIAA